MPKNVNSYVQACQPRQMYMLPVCSSWSFGNFTSLAQSFTVVLQQRSCGNMSARNSAKKKRGREKKQRNQAPRTFVYVSTYVRHLFFSVTSCAVLF